MTTTTLTSNVAPLKTNYAVGVLRAGKHAQFISDNERPTAYHPTTKHFAVAAKV